MALTSLSAKPAVQFPSYHSAPLIQEADILKSSELLGGSRFTFIYEAFWGLEEEV